MLGDQSKNILWSMKEIKSGNMFSSYRATPSCPVSNMKTFEPMIISFMISDIKANKMAELRKETFDEVMRTSGIICRYMWTGLCHMVCPGTYKGTSIEVGWKVHSDKILPAWTQIYGQPPTRVNTAAWKKSRLSWAIPGTLAVITQFSSAF